MAKKLKLKEEVAMTEAQKELKANIERLRVLIKATFFPWLLKNSTNIEEASILCQSLAGHVHAGFNVMAKKTTLLDLGLTEVVKNDEDGKQYLEAYKMLENESVNDALMILEGMSKAINSCVNTELKGRKLEDLKELVKEFE